MTLYFALCFAVLSAISDVKSRKIPNIYIVIGYLFGLSLRIVYAILEKSIYVLTDGVVGMIVPCALITIYIFGGIGAADIKLLSVIGLMIGKDNIFLVIIMSFLIGVVYGFATVVLQMSKGHVNKPVIIPFAVPILVALGTLVIWMNL